MSDQTNPGGAGDVQPPATDGPFAGSATSPDADSFWKKLEKEVANLADVTVATVLSNVTVGLDDRGRLAKVAAKNDQVGAIITNVNLVDGNVTTVIGNGLKDDAALTAFHQGLVDKAVKVLPDNINALVTAVKGLLGK